MPDEAAEDEVLLDQHFAPTVDEPLPVPASLFRTEDPQVRSSVTPTAPEVAEQEPAAARRRRRRRRGIAAGYSFQDFRHHAKQVWAEPLREHSTGTSMLSTKEVDKQHARAVVDLAGRVASAALGSGATAADSTALLLRIAQHYKVSVHADVTLSSVTITHFRSIEHDPVTVLRTVKTKITDYRRLELVEELVDEITHDGIALTEARKRIAHIVQMPKTYRRWVQTFATAMLGAWVTVLFGGGMVEVLLAGATCALVDLTVLGVAKLKAPEFFGQVAGAAICGAIALGVMWGRARPDLDVRISASLIVASGMISMLAGLSMTTAVRDAIDGYSITSAARLIEVATLTGGIVLGLTTTLYVGVKLGVPAYLSPTTGARPVWWLQLIAAAMIAVSFAINNHLTPRTWVLAGFFGMLTWAVSSNFGELVASPPGLVGAAAFAAGLVAQSLNRVVRVPTTALVTAGVVSLVPGMALYRGLLSAVQASQGQAVVQDPSQALVYAIITAVMIAAGASLGTTAGRPLSMPPDWSTRIALAKAWGRGRGDDRT